MTSLVLYSYYRSSCSYRVRIGLNLKGLPFEYRSVHLVRNGGEQHQTDFRATNPMAQVPSLIHGEHVISQSMAILLYLDRVFPAPALFPKDAGAYAAVIACCEMINSGIQPIQNLALLKELEARWQVDAAGKAHWIRHWIGKGFSALEQTLESKAGRYCFGDQVTAADLFLVPQIYNAQRFKLDMSLYPTLSRIHDACLDLEAFKLAAPEVQPDAPKT